RHVGRLAGRQDQGDRQTESDDRCVDFGAESTATAAQRFGFRTAVFWGAPAACWCARITVESKLSHSRSGSCKDSYTRCQTPLRDQRSNRFQTLPHLPKRSGRSRHGDPVLAIQRTASTNRRLSLAVTPGSPGWPESRCLIRSQFSSEIAWR